MSNLKHWSYYFMELIVMSFAALIGCTLGMIIYFNYISPTHSVSSAIQSQLKPKSQIK